MLKGEKLYFVESEHRRGTNKDGVPYEFANITLSDGLESFKIPLSLDLVNSIGNLKRKDLINIQVDISIGYNNRINLTVTDLSSVNLNKSA